MDSDSAASHATSQTPEADASPSSRSATIPTEKQSKITVTAAVKRPQCDDQREDVSPEIMSRFSAHVDDTKETTALAEPSSHHSMQWATSMAQYDDEGRCNGSAGAPTAVAGPSLRHDQAGLSSRKLVYEPSSS